MKPKSFSSQAIVYPAPTLPRATTSFAVPSAWKKAASKTCGIVLRWRLPMMETAMLESILENMLLMASHLDHASLMLAGMMGRLLEADFELLNAAETTLPHITFRGSLIAFKNVPWFRLELTRQFLKRMNVSIQMLEVTLHSLPVDVTSTKGAAKEATTLQMFAHDVRRPFSMLKAMLDMLRRTPDQNLRPLLECYTTDIQSSTDAVHAMLNEILKTGTKGKPRLTPVRLETIISASLNEVLAVHPAREVNFHFDFDNLSRVSVDHYQVGRVISNIISNALEAMHNRGTMLISASEKGRMMEVSIVNTGSCIDPDMLPKVFDTYFTSGKENGTGLGLAIAKKVVESHGGEIGCRSEKGGTEFFFTLPLAL